ncbi:MAG: hypothetical protein HYX47_15985 [Burkholderiales bacterium]|nr:hypothetical protein [Burkholderiales bacterium]
MINTLSGRCMFVWRLAPVIKAEMDVATFVRKAKAAHLSGVWIKIADGDGPYENARPANLPLFKQVRDGLRAEGIAVWGWQVPYGGSVEHAKQEAIACADLADQLELDGVLMDAEGGKGYFTGGVAAAEAYASTLQDRMAATHRGLAMCGNDIPGNFENYPFAAFVKHASFNAPQVYYGGSPSVVNRLSRAVEANKPVKLPFIPVGAGWVGPDGGCASASACAEKAREFLRLVKEHQFTGHSFWHWMGVPAALWEVLFEIKP